MCQALKLSYGIWYDIRLIRVSLLLERFAEQIGLFQRGKKQEKMPMSSFIEVFSFF